MPKRSGSDNDEAPAASKRTKPSTPQDPDLNMLGLKTTKRILVIGLAGYAPGHPKTAPAKAPRGQFREQLKDTVTKAKKADLELEMMQVKASAFQSALEDIKARLEAEPEGLLIGNGIRGTTEYTVFFEDVVNACREISPGTRMAFNTSPGDILECCLRNFSQEDSDELKARTMFNLLIKIIRRGEGVVEKEFGTLANRLIRELMVEGRITVEAEPSDNFLPLLKDPMASKLQGKSAAQLDLTPRQTSKNGGHTRPVETHRNSNEAEEPLYLPNPAEED